MPRISGSEKMAKSGMGELEEGELSSSDSDVDTRYLEHQSRYLRRGPDRRHYHDTPPPRGYRTPAGQRLLERRTRTAISSPSLKYKYHGTIDIVKKSPLYNSNPVNEVRYPPNSRLPSPPESNNIAEAKENVGKTNNVPSLMDLQVKRPLKLKQQVKYVKLKQPPSPSGDVEDIDYIDLLLEYKQIQKQLENLNKETNETELPEHKSELNSGSAATEEDPQEPANDNIHKYTDGKTADIKEDTKISQPLQDAFTENVGNNEEQKTEMIKDIFIGPEHMLQDMQHMQTQEEEDELSELELRLAALASAARGPASSQESGRSSQSDPKSRRSSSRDHRGGSRNETSKRARELNRHDSQPYKRRRALDERRDREERRLREDRERRDREERHRRDDKERRERARWESEHEVVKQEDRHLGLARVLALDSHEEQVDKFVQMLQDRGGSVNSRRDSDRYNRSRNWDSYEDEVDYFIKNVHERPSSKKSKPRGWTPELGYWQKLLGEKQFRDNYEEVEMDIDSEPDSPANIEVEVEAVHQLPWMPIEFPHVLPYASDFLLHPSARVNEQQVVPASVLPQALHLAASLPPPPPPPPPPPLPESSPAPTPQPPPPDSDTEHASHLPGSATPLPQVSEVEDVLSDAESDQESWDETQTPQQQEDEDDEEIDVEILRATLLHDLAQKRREKIALESGNSSPVSVESSAVINMNKSNGNLHSSKSSLHSMPQVEPVVITIGNESSDESDVENIQKKPSRKIAVGLDGQLDMFLAAQRQTVEASMKKSEKEKKVAGTEAIAQGEGKKSRKNLIERAQDLETHLRKVRAALVQDDSRLSAVRSQLEKRKRAMLTAEQKAAKLREQLAAAERIVAVSKEQTVRLCSEEERLNARINMTYSQMAQLESQTLKAGKAAYGEAYNLGIQLQPVEPNKPIQKKNAEEKMSSAAREKLNEEIAREKARLKERERAIAEKLRQLKEAQALAKAKKQSKTAATKAAKSKRVVKQNRRVSEHIPTTPVMSFNFGPEVEKEMMVVMPNRRRSLVDMSPSTVPNLPNLLPETKQLTEKKNEESSTGQKEKPVKFNMPSKEQLSNLSKMLSVSKMPASARHTNLTAKYQFSLETPLEITQIVLVPSLKTILQKEVIEKCEYSSPLQMFKSYRFCPYFRTKSRKSLTSNTFTNKLNPQQIICRFDLHGKCQDEKCPWQHQLSYELSDKEMLMEFASYIPQLAEIKTKSDFTEAYAKLAAYVEDFQKKNSALSHEERCMLLVSQLNSRAQHKYPHFMFYDKRKVKPFSTGGKSIAQSDMENSKLQWIKIDVGELMKENDDVLGDGDIRYWMLGSGEVQDMETAVLEHPKNINLWIKLASKKLHNPKQSKEKNIDSCLNVLSRGLEENKTSSELWQYYLKIYSQRADNKELLSLCIQSLKYAPTYQLHCKYLRLLDNYEKREEHCEAILNWLKESKLEAMQRSHWILETLLYQVTLATNCGRFRNAIRTLQSFVLDNGNSTPKQTVRKNLTAQDTGLLWLCYIHLLEFRYLPPTIYDPANSNNHTIVSKEPFLFPWEMGKPTRNSADYLESRFKEALQAVAAKELTSDLTETLLFIYRNWILMELVCKRKNNAKNLCSLLLEKSNGKKIDILMCRYNIEISTGCPELAKKVLQDASKQVPFSSHLSYTAAMLEVSQGKPDNALEILEIEVVSKFEVEISDKLADPNLLYRRCLSLPLPVKYKCPKMKDVVSATSPAKQHLYLWLSYWLLLELQGDRGQANQMFDLALGAVSSPTDIHTLWRSYLQYHLYKYSMEAAEVRDGMRKKGKPMLLDQLMEMLHRCLLTLPTKFQVANQPGRYWLDYTRHNDIIELLLPCLPDALLTTFYEKMIVWMPDNMVLIQRACEHFIKEGNRAAARGISMTALQSHPACLSLWKIHMALVQKDGTYSEVKKMYRRALQHISLTLSLWKDLLVYEMVCGNQQSVEQVIQQCEDKGLNIHDFLSTICGPGPCTPTLLLP